MLEADSRDAQIVSGLAWGPSLQRDHESEVSQPDRLGKLPPNYQSLSIDEREHRLTSAGEAVSSLCCAMYYSKQVKKSVLVSIEFWLSNQQHCLSL